MSGIAIWTPACAIYFTGGRTMLLPVPVFIIAAGWFAARGKNSRPFTNCYAKSLYGLCFAAVVTYFLFYSQAFWSWDSDFIKYPSGDLAYYSRLARHLTKYGVENRLVDLPAEFQKMWQPYHWGDIWMIPLIAKTTGLPEEESLLLVIYPLLSAAFVMGLYSLYRNAWPSRRFLFMGLCISAPFITSFIFFIPPPWKYQFHFFTAPVAQYPKLLLAGCMILWSLKTANERRYEATILLMVATSLMFITVLPSLMLVAAGFALYTLMKHRRRWLPLILLGTAFGLGLLWCAFLLKYSPGKAPFLPELIRSKALVLFPWKIFLSGIIESSMTLPYFFLLAAFLYHSRKSPAWLLFKFSMAEWLLCGWLLAALLIRAILYNTVADSFQFLENVRMIFVPVFTIWCAGIYFHYPKGRLAGTVLLILIVCGICNNWYFSKEAFLTDRISKKDFYSVQQLQQKIPPEKLLNCLFIKSPVATNRSGTRNSTVFYPLEFLSLSGREYQAASLNAPGLDEIDTTAINFRESQSLKWYTPLLQFAHARGLDAAGSDKIIRDFANATKPVLLIAANDAALPDCLRAHLTGDSIQLQSKKYRVFLMK